MSVWLRTASECTGQPTENITASSTPSPTIAEKINADVPSAELRLKPRFQEEGIVTDSATLRLSVKDKIKRLSQAQGKNDIQSQTPSFKQKAFTLPRDSQQPEKMPEGRLSSSFISTQ